MLRLAASRARPALCRAQALMGAVRTCHPRAPDLLSSRLHTASALRSSRQAHTVGRGAPSTHRQAVRRCSGPAKAQGGLAVWYARKVDEENLAELSDPNEIVEPPPEEFVHPYTLKPWWWRLLFTIKRALYIAWVFAPVAGIGLVNKLVYPESEEWRKAFLDALLAAVEQAGCCFMKLGQWISMRPDMFPRDLVNLMSKLRNGAATHSYEHTREQIKLSFGKEIEEIFEAFDPVAVASGTVAQVHKARLKPEHAIHGKIQDVAVKVRHPNVLEETFVDLDLIFNFVETVMPRSYSMPCSQDDLLHILRQQLDLKCEAYNLYMFSRNFRNELSAGLISFPQVSKQLCSDSVLVESWVEGSTIATMFSEMESGHGHTWQTVRTLGDKFSDAMQEKKRQLARILFDMNVKMFLRDNYVHGDMHAGNLIFSMEDGRVTVIDAGLITSLKPDIANSFGDFLRALCSSDVDTIVEKLLQFNIGRMPVNRQQFKERIADVTRKWDSQAKTEGGTYALGDVVGEILLQLQHFNIVLRGDVAASIMTISVSEGLILQLDPEFDLVQSALPFFVRYKGWKSAQAALMGNNE